MKGCMLVLSWWETREQGLGWWVISSSEFLVWGGVEVWAQNLL